MQQIIAFLIFAGSVAATATEKYPFRNAPLASPQTKFGAHVAASPGIDERHPLHETPCFRRINDLHEKQRKLEEWMQVHLTRVDVEARCMTPDLWVGIWDAWEKDGEIW